MRATRLLVALTGVLAMACGRRGADRNAEASVEPQSTDSTPVRFTVDVGKQHAISPYIYGINGYDRGSGTNTPAWPRGITLNRFGGNRLTAYNWENNASNAGNDYNYQNDDYLGGGNVPGEAARVRIDGAARRGAGTIVTIPMIGYVARDAAGTTVGTDAMTVRTRLASRFVKSEPRKPGPFAATPNLDDDTIYQDEFVHWLTRRFPGAATNASTPLFFCLDNEPDLWGSTHEEIMPKVGDKSAVLTYDELIDRTIAYARAIKNVEPRATIFGPGVATWTGALTLGRWPSPDPKYGRRPFIDVYLERLRDAERASGRRLLDVLDLHWYPAGGADGQGIATDVAEQSPAMEWARLQAPRSLWDSTYDERSWVSEVQSGPIRLLPLLREKIAAHYPGTKLAITEYYYGRGGDITGGIAQADVLGIFGREGVFAATLWPNANLSAVPYGGNPDRAYRYVIGAFRMFRDYDGRGGKFGDLGLAAGTSDVVGSSVYASADDTTAARVVIVAINKLSRSRAARLELTGSVAWSSAESYTLTDGAPEPHPGRAPVMDGPRALDFTMPPRSVSTIVLRR
jgi:hypothetical protein